MTILDDNKYIAENKYRQYLQNTINQNATWEIEVQLSVAPVSNFGWLIINPDSSSTREEIFYHRKDWNSVFVYDVNRTDAKTHADWSLVVLNNTAWIYNFKEKLNDNIFYHYKISDNDLYIFGWVIVDFHWVRHDIDNFSTDSLSMTNNATNYIYIWTLDDWVTYEPLVTTTNSNDLFIIKEVTKDPVWVITSINEWRQSWRWISTNGWMWIKWDDGNWIVNIELLSTVWKIKTYRINFTDSTTFTYEVIDWEAITLPVYTITNDIATRTLNANSVSLHWLADVVSTLIKDIKDWIDVIATDWEDWAPWAPWVDWLDGNWIESITLISTVWKVKTYRITYTDTTTFDYTVTDWADWIWWDMFKSENLSWLTSYPTARTNLWVYSSSEVDALIPDISWKQDVLVSWTNIKTINWNSVLWSWDMTISSWWWDQKLLRKVVAATWWDYTSIQEAFTAWEWTLYIQWWTYEMWTISTSLSLNNHIDIIAEDSCIFNIDLNTANLFEVTTESNIKIKWWKWNITLSNSSINTYNLFTPFASSWWVRPLYYSLESLNINLIKTSTNQSTLWLVNQTLSNIYYNWFYNVDKVYFKTQYWSWWQNWLSIYYNNSNLIWWIFNSSFQCDCSDTYWRDSLYIIWWESFFVKWSIVSSSAEPVWTNRLRIVMKNPIWNILNARRNMQLYWIIENNITNINWTTDSTFDYWTTNYRYDISWSKVSNNYFNFNYNLWNWYNITSSSDHSHFIWNSCKWWQYVKIWTSWTNQNFLFTLSNNTFELAFSQSSIAWRVDITDVNTMFNNNQIHSNYLSSWPAWEINISWNNSNVIWNTFKKWGTAWTINNTSTWSQVLSNLSINI